jgi:hypothetical protein
MLRGAFRMHSGFFLVKTEPKPANSWETPEKEMHMRLSVYVVLVVLILAGAAAGAGAPDWRADLDRVLAMEPGPERDAVVGAVAGAAPGWNEIRLHIQAMEFDPPRDTLAILDSTMCTDGVTRPWVLYVSTHYDPATPAPLLVRIHGAVGTPRVRSDALKYGSEDEFAIGIQERGWLGIYPMGQEGATWWDEVGMANIHNLIRRVKRDYNVDDDRVYMCGFSDGGSGAFAHAMLAPTDYAAFLALNGHMGVASRSGDMSLYAPNMMNTPIYATTTHDDRLYPTAKMQVTFDMAAAAGADIMYRTFAGEHDFEDIRSDLGFMWEFLERHPRDPFPSSIVWEAADRKYGACRWFAVEGVTAAPAERWHGDHNATLVDDRITFGFIADYEYEGDGVYVGRVLEGTAAEAMGLLADDIIVRGEDMHIGNSNELDAYKQGLRRGGPFGVTVKRGDELVVLRGSLPEPENYLLFKRKQPSARADVTCLGNHIMIRASRLGAFRVLVHPDMVNLDENLVITVNRKVVYDDRVEPDLEFMIRNFLENRDRKLLYVAAVDISLEPDGEEEVR